MIFKVLAVDTESVEAPEQEEIWTRDPHGPRGRIRRKEMVAIKWSPSNHPGFFAMNNLWYKNSMNQRSIMAYIVAISNHKRNYVSNKTAYSHRWASLTQNLTS